MAKLYLIPTTLSNTINSSAALESQLEGIKHIRHFIVETAKIGRLHLKQLNLATPLQELSINELNKHNQDLDELVAPLLNGYDLGLLSDCGLPAIADPGSGIVKLAHKIGIEVVPLIGPSSIFLALMSSGVNGQSFAFNGYLPIDKEERINKIQQLKKQVLQSNQSQIFIEAPFRNQQLLETLILGLPDDFMLSISVDLMNPSQRIISYPIKFWKTLETLPDIHKKKVVFVIGV